MDYLKRKFSVFKNSVSIKEDEDEEGEEGDGIDEEEGAEEGYNGDENEDTDLKRSLKSLFDFLENHRPSIYGWCYHIFLLVSNLTYMIIILMESSDGPNYYVGSGRNAQLSALYPTLPTFASYYGVKLFLTLPLLIHCLVRLVVVVLVSRIVKPFKNSRRSFSVFKSRYSNWVLCFAWYWPFLVVISNPSLWPLDKMILYHLIDFLRHAQILASLREIPSFLVIVETYKRVLNVVPIPVFVFFGFNIFFGLIIYIIDPCFSITCPFPSLFQSVFFSIVTMTTTGYGNQTPLWVPGRIIAFGIMLFGAPYLAIPIGIIDQEFGRSWREEISRQQAEEAIAKESGIVVISDRKTIMTNAVLAGPQNISMEKFQIVSLHSAITELFIGIQSGLLVIINSPEEVEEGEQARRWAPIVLKLSTVQSKMSTMIDGLYAATGMVQSRDSAARATLGGNGGVSSSSKKNTGMGRASTIARPGAGVGGVAGVGSQQQRGGGGKSFMNPSIKLGNQSDTANLIARLASEARKSPLKSYLRLLLDVPSSSDEAYVLNLVIICSIFVSIAILFWQTMIGFTAHGESSVMCQGVLQVYCSNKGPSTDPGCYSLNSLAAPGPQHLQYNCPNPAINPNCFGYPGNFGSYMNLSCDPRVPGYIQPFQDQSTLPRVTFLSPRNAYQQNFAVCKRQECYQSVTW